MPLVQPSFYTVVLPLVEMEFVIRLGVGVCRRPRMKRVEIDGLCSPLLDGAGIKVVLFNRGHTRRRAMWSSGTRGTREQSKLCARKWEGEWGRVGCALLPWTAAVLALYFGAPTEVAT